MGLTRLFVFQSVHWLFSFPHSHTHPEDGVLSFSYNCRVCYYDRTHPRNRLFSSSLLAAIVVVAAGRYPRSHLCFGFCFAIVFLFRRSFTSLAIFFFFTYKPFLTHEICS